MKSALVALLLVLVTGCGGGGDDGKSDPANSTTAPKCADVWVAGKSLPAKYEGCENEDGSIEAAISVDCKDGSKLLTYDDRFWVLGSAPIAENVGEAAEDPAYGAAFEKCAG